MTETEDENSEEFEAFAEALIQQLRLHVDGEVQRPSKNSIKYNAEGGDGIANVYSLYETYRRSPPELQGETMDRFIEMIVAGLAGRDLSDFEEVRSRLMPKIWSRWSFAAMALESLVSGESSALQMPTRLLGDHLILTFVLDSETMMSSVDWGAFRSWGLSFEEVLEIAIENADAATVMLGARGEDGDSGRCLMAAEDNYDSIRFLSEVPHQEMNVSIPRWAFPAARDTCVICSAERTGHIDSMLKMAFESSQEDPKPLPPFPLVDYGKGWVAWKPELGHALDKAFLDRQRDYLLNLYQEQRSLLQLSASARKDFAFVAPLTAVSDVELSLIGIEGCENGLRTATTWQQGTECLLPEAEFINFPDHDGALVPWQRFVSICPDLIALAEAVYPRRWRTYGYPSEEQFEQLSLS